MSLQQKEKELKDFCIERLEEIAEEMNFGESHTDFSSSEAVVNMYTYVVGENIIQECFDEVVEKLEDKQLSLEIDCKYSC